ncbi:oligosaccharide flippase family protein [Candidatus Woesearchaeota archaeon]|nr:oligosaccharide flippase family protein [Candidatus Woesearchaeota archaeon]
MWKLPSYFSKTKVRKETTYAMAYQLIVAVFGLLFVVLIPNIAGIELYGQLQTVFAYAALLGVFFSGKVSLDLYQTLSSHKFSSTSRVHIFSSLRARLLFAAITAVLFCAWLVFFPVAVLLDHIVLVIVFVLVSNFFFFFISLFEPLHRQVYPVIAIILFYVLELLLLTALYAYNWISLSGLLISYIASYGAGIVFLLAILCIKLPRSNKEVSSLSSSALKALFIITLAYLFWILVEKIDILMISSMLGSVEVGNYSIAASLTKKALALSIPFIAGAAPLFANHRKVRSFYLSTLWRLLTINAIIVVLLLILAPLIIPFLYSSSSIVPLMQVLAFSPLIYAVGHLSSRLAFIRGDLSIILLFNGIAACTNVVLNYVGILFFGAFGAAMATLIAIALWAGLNIAYVKVKVF